MASTFTLESHKYQGRYMYLQCEQVRNIANNTSTIQWKLVVTGGTSNYYTTGPTTVKINGTVVYSKAKTSWDSYAFPAAKGSVSGSTTIKHGDSGDAKITLSIETNIYTGVLQTSTGTWTLDSIPRFAELKTASNFNDEENPTITYSNPAGTSVTSLQACISLNGTDAKVAYRDLDKTGSSYTFSLTSVERDILRSATLDSNERKVIFRLRSTIGDTSEASDLERTFTIKDPNPTISATIVDTNSDTINVTGDSSKLVKYISNAKVTVVATAVKKAKIDAIKVINSGTTLYGDGTINGVTSNSFKLIASDSRNNRVEQTVTPTFINYVKPTCVISNNTPDTSGKYTLKITGNYFNGSFGKPIMR